MAKDGGPAFPRPDERDQITGQGIMQGSHGMSLRDWFAGQALSGFTQMWPKSKDGPQIAERCYDIADSLLAKREKEAAPPAPTDIEGNVRAILADYHLALDHRAHGDLASGAAINALEELLNARWVQGAEAKRRLSEPVPAGVYYHAESDNFYDAGLGNIGKGVSFWETWKARKAEFPTTREAALGEKP